MPKMHQNTTTHLCELVEGSTTHLCEVMEGTLLHTCVGWHRVLLHTCASCWRVVTRWRWMRSMSALMALLATRNRAQISLLESCSRCLMTSHWRRVLWRSWRDERSVSRTLAAHCSGTVHLNARTTTSAHSHLTSGRITHAHWHQSKQWVDGSNGSVFTARCYASAVLAMALCPCLCVSVTSRCSTKTAKHRIIQTTPHDTPGTLVFWCQDLREIRLGSPPTGTASGVG